MGLLGRTLQNMFALDLLSQPMQKQLPAPQPNKQLPAPRTSPTQTPARKEPVQVTTAPPQTPSQRFESFVWKSIRNAWNQASQPLEKAKRGQCKVRPVIPPTHKTSVAVFQLELTGYLPTPQVKTMAENAFLLALRSAMAATSQNEEMIERVTVRLNNRNVEITVPRPGRKPSTHLRGMVKFLPAKSEQAGLIGVNSADRLVKANLKDSPVWLFVGMTQTGKTANLLGILGGLMVTHSPDDLWIYLCAAKPDDWDEGFTELPHVKRHAIANPYKIAHIISEAAGLIEDHGKIDRKQRPLVLLILDDLSYIASLDNFNQIAGELVQITQTGGAVGVKTLITTHDVAQESVGRASIAKHAGVRIATFMQSSASADPVTTIARNLGVNANHMNNLFAPKPKEEAAIAIAGQAPDIVRTVWSEPGAIHDAVMTNKQWNVTNNASAAQHSFRQEEEILEIDNCAGGAEGPEQQKLSPVSPIPGPFPTHINGNGNGIHNGRNRNGTNGYHMNGSNGHNAIEIDGARVPEKLRNEVLEFHENSCYHCGGNAEVADHLVPYSRGGATSIDNLVAACAACNHEKGSKTHLELVLSRIKSLGDRMSQVRQDSAGAYQPTPWQKIHLFIESKRGKTTSALVREQGKNAGSFNGKIERWVNEGETLFGELKQAAGRDVETRLLVEEIERNISEEK